MIRKTSLGLIIATLAFAAALTFSAPLMAAGGRSPELNVVLSNVLSRLDREAQLDPDGAVLLFDLLVKEFGTRVEELEWGLDHELSGGEIAALAYIQATTGKSFAEMNQNNARRNFWSYAENAGMSCNKMARWFEAFHKRVEHERNSRIFERLRVSRKVHPLPDLGSGFGLLQEALDFRRIDSPRPTKIHDVPGVLAKGDK